MEKEKISVDELLKDSKDLYYLCKILASKIDYNEFKLVREDWNLYMGNHEQLMKEIDNQ